LTRLSLTKWGGIDDKICIDRVQEL
jgi:hypothetical protein